MRNADPVVSSLGVDQLKKVCILGLRPWSSSMGGHAETILRRHHDKRAYCNGMSVDCKWRYLRTYVEGDVRVGIEM